MRSVALSALGVVVALAILAALAPGQAALAECARAAFASDEVAALRCGRAAISVLGIALVVLLLVAVIVNVLDEWRFATRGEPPQPALLATLATFAALLAVAALLPARFAALAVAPSLSAAVERALQLIAALAAALAGILGALAGLAIWLGKRPSDPNAAARRPYRN